MESSEILKFSSITFCQLVENSVISYKKVSHSKQTSGKSKQTGVNKKSNVM